ncbi:condensation domain-containing protein [Paenibacillus elgii]
MLHAELYQFVILKMNDREICWGIKMHHMISDGISMNLIANQIMQTYSELVKGACPSGEVKHSYIDYIKPKKNTYNRNVTVKTASIGWRSLIRFRRR